MTDPGPSAPPGLSPEEAENAVLASLTGPALLELASLLAQAPSAGALPSDLLNRVVGKVAFGLKQAKTPEAGRSLTALYQAGLLEMESLPSDLQERVVALRLAEQYLGRREATLASLESAEDPESYRLRSRPAGLMVPLLVEQGRLSEAAELVGLFARHAQEGTPRAALAEEAIGSMVQAGALEEAKGAFLAAGREERDRSAELLSRFGERSIPYLAAVVRETADPWKRKQSCDLLLAWGGAGRAALVELAEDPRLDPEGAAIALRVLGGVEDPDLAHLAAETALARAQDPAPEVRRAALRSLCLLSPRGRFESFRGAMEDPDEGVRREAIRGLGLSGDEKALPLLKEMIDGAEREGAPGGWESAAPAVDALGHALGSVPSQREETARFLLELADRALPPGLVSRLFHPRRVPDLVLLALAHALSRMGGDRPRAYLTRLSRHPDPSLAQRAASFLSHLP